VYIFRLPAKAHEIDWTYEGLRTFLLRGTTPDRRKIGTTVAVEQGGFDTLRVRLYDTVIAYVSPDNEIHVPVWVNQHITHATREWLTLITGVQVASERFHYNVAGTIIKDRRIVRHV